MRATVLALALAAALPAAARSDICARGARIETLPLSYALAAEAMEWRVEAYGRVDWSNPDGKDDLMFAPEARPLRDLMAEESAALPASARDLPYLILLASLEDYPEAALDGLTIGGESEMAARLLDAMDRNGLDIEAGLLRQAVGLFPDWGDSPRDRSNAVYPAGDGESPLRQALWKLAEDWPRGHRAEEAATALIAAHPALAAEYQERLKAASDQDRLAWLTARLWSECLQGWWLPDEADRAFFSTGSAQTALLLMESFLAESLNGSAHQYFSNSSGTMAPHLARVLDLRGLPDHAAAIRSGMALFPAPYPRDTDQRRGVMDGFSEAQNKALEDLTRWADDGVIEAEMIELAREAGLLPDLP